MGYTGGTEGVQEGYSGGGGGGVSGGGCVSKDGRYYYVDNPIRLDSIFALSACSDMYK